MSYYFDNKRLKEEHKLKVRRIWWNRGLAAAVIVIVGIGAYFLAPEYASELKKAEIEYQSDLELKKSNQEIFYSERYRAYQEVDSLFRLVNHSYFMALNCYTGSFDSTICQDRLQWLLDACGPLYKAIKRNYPYLGEMYREQVARRCQIYHWMAYVSLDDWVSTKAAFLHLADDVTFMRALDIVPVSKDSAGVLERPIYMVPPFDTWIRDSVGSFDEYRASLTMRALSKVQLFVDSIKDSRNNDVPK